LGEAAIGGIGPNIYIFKSRVVEFEKGLVFEIRFLTNFSLPTKIKIASKTLRKFAQLHSVERRLSEASFMPPRLKL